jgi:bacillithiol biosynthesis cysteine-adding enzyme BshC
MNVQTVSWSQLPATDLFRDYLYRFERLRDWLPGPPLDAEAHRRQMEVRRAFFQRLPHQTDWPAWVQAWDPSAGETVEPTASLVVTGQQPGLLGGPLFTLYKIATALRLAEWWRDHGESVGAAFWVLDEDHDLKELLTVTSLDAQSRPVRPDLPGDVTANRRPVGLIRVDDERVAGVVRFHADCIRPGLYETAIGEAVRAAYGDGRRTLDGAFREYLRRLLAGFPLPGWVSARQVALKRAALPVLVRLVERWAEWLEAWDRWMEALDRRGYHRQVQLHRDYFPMFRLLEGERHRLLWRNGHIVCAGTGEQWTPSAFARWLVDHVAEISPNVVLRPLVQDFVLPTVAYVAGPSETAYWAQLRFLYDCLEIPMPVVFPRLSLTLVPPPLRRIFQKTGLDAVRCLTQPASAWTPAFDEAPPWAPDVERMEADLRAFHARMLDVARTQGLPHTERWHRALDAVELAFQRFRNVAEQAWRERHSQWASARQAIADWLWPLGEMQERAFHPAVLWQFVGPAVAEAVYRMADPWTPDHQVLWVE